MKRKGPIVVATIAAPRSSPAGAGEPYSLRGLLVYFLRLGTFGFGRPIALVGYMQRDLVETRGWISEQEYALYVHFDGLEWMQGALYGIGAGVVAIIARSAYELARVTLGKDRLLGALFAGSALVTAWTEAEIVWLLLLSGAIALATLAVLGRAKIFSEPVPILLAGVIGVALRGLTP